MKKRQSAVDDLIIACNMFKKLDSALNALAETFTEEGYANASDDNRITDTELAAYDTAAHMTEAEFRAAAAALNQLRTEIVNRKSAIYAASNSSSF